MGVLSQGAMPKAADGRGPTNYDSLILQSLEVMGTIRAGDTTISPAGITGISGSFENVNITTGTFSDITVDDITMTNAVITGSITITGGSGLANLSDADAAAIAETATLKWAGETGADVTAGKSLTVLTDKLSANITESGTNYFAGISGADLKSTVTATLTASGVSHTVTGTIVVGGDIKISSGGGLKFYSDSPPTAQIGGLYNSGGEFYVAGTSIMNITSGGDMSIQAGGGEIRVTGTLQPQSEGMGLGATSYRWAGKFTTISASGTSTLGVVTGTSFQGDHKSSDGTAGLTNAYIGTPLAITYLQIKDGLITSISF